MPAINAPRPAAKPSRPSGGNGSFASGQKAFFMLAAALVGPAVMKKMYDKPDTVDLSSFNIVTSYDTPAIERMDSTLRIEFCAA